MRFLAFVLITTLIWPPVPAAAEIRVFLLRIAKKGKPQDFRLVKSSLDPLQYPYFYPVAKDEVVTYDDTWRCRGRTGDFRAYCKSPREIAAEKSPESGPSGGPETAPPAP